MYSCVTIYTNFDIQNYVLTLYVFVYNYKLCALLEMNLTPTQFPNFPIWPELEFKLGSQL